MQSKPSFEKFIAEKPLYYKEIDHKRVHLAYDKLKSHIHRPLTIHIVGTNGKGSTGRIMATLLHCEGKKVGHFSSPHIVKFNERIWIEGFDISDEDLELAHSKLYNILGKDMSEALSYFEYTTLLALVATEKMDVMILEAGLGGEFDATNVVPKELSVITPIGIDHQDFLGTTIQEIAQTKLNSISNQAVLAIQTDEVHSIAQKIAQEKKLIIFQVEREENKALLELTQRLDWAYYLYQNTKLAFSALDILELNYSLDSLNKVKLFGRFYPILPNVLIDVGHNLLATEALVPALKKKYKNEKVILVYNSLDDKEYAKILSLLKPFLKWVEIIPIKTNRTVEEKELQNVLNGLSLKYKKFININENHKYFVFGSFYVIEAFLEKIEYSIKNK